MNPYYEIPILKHIYLEDSFVVGIKSDKVALQFTIEFVLTKNHKDYTPRLKGEQHCYKKGVLKFNDCSAVDWLKVEHVRYIDKNREIDMGNIDTFTFHDNKYLLSGDWGEVKVICERISLSFFEDGRKGSN